MKAYFTDARASGDHYYRGELYYGTYDRKVLIAVTRERYVTVEDAKAGATRYIRAVAERRVKVA